MRLSLRALEICRVKYGKGIFCGMELVEESYFDELAEADIRKDYDILLQNEMIENATGTIRISALGQHILGMLVAPEQYIMINNVADSVCVRVYIKNAYYLCVLEDKKVEAYDEYDRYIVELLPNLDLVVGSFVHAIHREEAASLMVDDGQNPLEIVGKAWNKDGEVCSEITISGEYFEEGIHCQMLKPVKEEFDCESYRLINKITEWVLKNIAATYESEVG